MRIVARCCLGTGLALTLLVAASTPVVATSPGVRPLVGAYYYLWNPENFAGGTLRAHLVPPQQPAGSLVNSQSPRTAARDITNARAAGINFFAIDWWPYDPGYSGADYRAADGAMRDFLAAPNIAQMKFAMFYETWNLGFDPGRRVHTGRPFRWSCTSTRHVDLRQALLPQSVVPPHTRPTGRLPLPDPDVDR